MNPDLPLPAADLVDIIEIAVSVESVLHRTIDSFELPGARLYGVNCSDEHSGDDTPETSVCFLAQHPDVYQLLEAPGSALARMFDAAAIVTTGWAAPLGPDGVVEGAPSEHAMRRRVRLVVTIADHGTASVLRFADTPDDVVTDPGSATGSLAEAIDRFWFNPPSATVTQRF